MVPNLASSHCGVPRAADPVHTSRQSRGACRAQAGASVDTPGRRSSRWPPGLVLRRIPRASALEQLLDHRLQLLKVDIGKRR